MLFFRFVNFRVVYLHGHKKFLYFRVISYCFIFCIVFVFGFQVNESILCIIYVLFSGTHEKYTIYKYEINCRIHGPQISFKYNIRLLTPNSLGFNYVHFDTNPLNNHTFYQLCYVCPSLMFVFYTIQPFFKLKTHYVQGW